MKSHHAFLFRIAITILAPCYIFSRSHRVNLIVLGLSGIIFLFGCFNHFYDTNTKFQADKDFLDYLRTRSKVFIAHFSDTIVQLTSLNTDDTSLQAVAQRLPISLSKQLNPIPNKPNKYKPQDDSTVNTQVHLYSLQYKGAFEEGSKGTLRIPLTAFTRIDVYEKNQERTNKSTVGSIFAIIGIVSGAVAVGFMIAFLIACNCPQIYVLENGVYRFKSGLYSGAVFSTLERSDYLVLHSFPPASDSLHIRVENVAGEQQFINRLQLLKVSHSPDTRVLTDRHGKIYSFKTPVSPVAVHSKSGDELLNPVMQKDNLHAAFNYGEQGESTSAVILKFPANMAGKKARLILRASNTMWAGYLNKEFRSLFGHAYAKWAGKQEKRSSVINENWLIEQSLPLKVSTQHANGQWHYVDYFPMTGNTAKRDLIMEIDLPATPFQTIDIRLETVYRFWEIDYAALDNSDQVSIRSEWLNPVVARHSNGNLTGRKLAAVDTSYVRLSGKEHINLIFSLQNKPDSNFTYFLCGTGYYHQAPLNENKPDIRALKRFREPGAFHAFSVEKYNMLTTALAGPAHHTSN